MLILPELEKSHKLEEFSGEVVRGVKETPHMLQHLTIDDLTHHLPGVNCRFAAVFRKLPMSGITPTNILC